MPALFELLVTVLLGCTIGGLLFRALGEQRQQQRLQEAFYRLLKDQAGCIALIQLAAAAHVEAETAQTYLDKQVKIFAATIEVDMDGDRFYRFPKLQTALSEHEESW